MAAMGKRWLALAGMLAFAGSAFGSEQVFRQKYPLNSGGTFQLTNVNGSIHVDGWEKNEAEVEAVLSGATDEDLNRVAIDVEGDARSLVIRTRYPQTEGVDVAVEYNVHVPNHVHLAGIATVNGNVVVRGVDGWGDLRSVNGSVDVIDGAGAFSVHTTNGNIHVELFRLDARRTMGMGTVNGSVVLALPEDASADLAVLTWNGDFRSDLSLASRSALVQHAFRGRLGAGGPLIELRTMNGGIRVVAARPSI